ncbi:unnamed protein product, partial [Mesorhabditis belari]|uniref:Uncharacterized protein n=1 Tax=Mesorhabditis belari TaxID=2138241 RepID=A0AAF3FPF5_9BILA
MSQIQDISQLREFLTVYNTLTERCFNNCISDFNAHKPLVQEQDCVNKCIDKSMRVESSFDAKNPSRRKMKIINEHGFRCDGRKAQQIRNISAQLGHGCQLGGAAYLVQGNTQVICHVYGPHEATQRSRMQDDRCFINCQYERFLKSRSKKQNNMKKRTGKDRKSGDSLQRISPRSQIDIHLMVIEEDGSLLSTCINAATLALCDAGIPMKGVVSATTCGIAEGTVICDLNNREENDLVPRITLATISGRDECVLVELQNRVHVAHLPNLLNTGKAMCLAVHECLHTAIRDHLLHTIPIS